MNVRKAERGDAQTLFEFVLKLDCDGASRRRPIVSVDDILAAGFGPDPLFEAFIAETIERLRLDDVVGAIPVHLAGGIWGTLAVCLTNPDGSIVVQLAGIFAIGAFTLAASFVIWQSIRLAIGLRLRSAHEEQGGDMTEFGMRAYNIG